MAELRAEDDGLLPVSLKTARERLPDALRDLGYEPDGEEWKRRRERCRWSACSLPDACPTRLRVRLEPPEGEAPSDRRTRYRFTYRVQMPGQILAHTDAKALELEADRLMARLIGQPEPDIRLQRKELVRLTLAANIALSLLPGLALWGVFWAAWDALPGRSSTMLLEAVVAGIIAWGIALGLTAKIVVSALNRRVKTRLRYSRARKGVNEPFD